MDPASTTNATQRKETWQALERAVDEGKIRYIGVSNYLCSHLKELLTYCRVRPFLNQFELHPLYQPNEVIQLCQIENIHIQGYSSFGEGNFFDLTKYPMPEITQLENKYKATRAQILLAWNLSLGYYTIPKTTHLERMKENLKCDHIKLTKDEIQSISNLMTAQGEMKFCWNPAKIR
jgi:diketogulonate reductase-like aldo/keto reductase